METTFPRAAFEVVAAPEEVVADPDGDVVEALELLEEELEAPAEVEAELELPAELVLFTQVVLPA